MVAKSAQARGEARRLALVAALAHPRDRSASLDDLARELGWIPRTVHYHLGELVKRGVVANLGGARGYRLTDSPEQAADAPVAPDGDQT